MATAGSAGGLRAETCLSAVLSGVAWKAETEALAKEGDLSLHFKRRSAGEVEFVLVKGFIG